MQIVGGAAGRNVTPAPVLGIDPGASRSPCSTAELLPPMLLFFTINFGGSLFTKFQRKAPKGVVPHV